MAALWPLPPPPGRKMTMPLGVGAWGDTGVSGRPAGGGAGLRLGCVWRPVLDVLG